MKKTFAIIVFFLFALLAWNVFSGGMNVDIDGDHVDGPLGALLGLVFAGGGMLLAGVITLFVGAVLAAVFTGVGILLAGGLALGMAMLALAISPLLLPLLLPLAVIWYVFGRSRKQRMLREQAV
jgi:NaMN:DMB phosphoribosyltransferase